MRIQFRVLGHREPTQVGNRGKPDRARNVRCGMFHDDNDGRARPGQTGVLKRAYLGAAGHHQTGMRIRVHLIGRLCVYQG